MLAENKSGLTLGRVIRVSGQLCLVEIDDQINQYKIRGRLKTGQRTFNTPIVAGDMVDVKLQDNPEHGVIERVRNRKSHFTRAASGRKGLDQVILANIDKLLIVVSIKQPNFNSGFIDRAIVSAHSGRIKPIIIVNKIDLIDSETLKKVIKCYTELDYPVYCTSAKENIGIGDVINELKGLATAVVGQSGVGKSSLLNRVNPELGLRTNEIMVRHDRGRHTTTAIQLFPLDDGGYLADTPGIKQLQVSGIDRSSLFRYFSEMEPLSDECKFRDCSHLNEPGCAIIFAVKNGLISQNRYTSYVRIMEDLSNE